MGSEKDRKTDFMKEKAPFAKLMRANYSRFCVYIINLFSNDADADDLMQETATMIWENFDRFEPGPSFVSRAVTIAKFQFQIL